MYIEPSLSDCIEEMNNILYYKELEGSWLDPEYDDERYEEHQRGIMCLEKVIEILEKISGGDKL